MSASCNLKLCDIKHRSSLVTVLFVLICFSFAFTYVEQSMPTYSDALWYCFAIVTTIGFGDITATSSVGRILSIILGIYGIIVIALITSIIVNFYNELNKEKLSFENDNGKIKNQNQLKEADYEENQQGKS